MMNKAGFREGGSRVDQIFTLKQIGERESMREKMQCVCGFYRFGEGV